jgi:hypothetical protein
MFGGVTALLLVAGATACGSTTTNARSSPRVASAVARTTSLGSDPHHLEVLAFGREAIGADRAAVTALVTNYYKAAAGGDGETACSLLLRSMANSVVEDYAHAPGPRYLRGERTCPHVMSRIFAHRHREMTVDSTTLNVIHVRVGPKGGYAVLRFGPKRERELTVVREKSGAWRVSSLLDSALF